MIKLRQQIQNVLLVSLVAFSKPAFAASKKDPKASLPAVLKADKIDGDRVSNVLNATGNVELTKDGSTLFTDKLSYDKNNGNVEALGNIKIKNYDIGNVLASKADVKSDLKSGHFFDATIVFNDGSYIASPKITRNSEVETVFNKPIFSICPNNDIKDDNSLAGDKRDVISITSRTTTINKATQTIKTKDGVLRFYDIPVLYTPYLSMPLPSSKRKSGLLHPSYVQSTKLGLGFKLPYYFDIAPNKDLTSTAEYHPSGQHFLLDNEYRHLLRSGSYNVKLELANNKPKTNDLIGNYDNENDQQIRWKGFSKGSFILPKNWGADFNIDTIGDKNYLRDYHNQFLGLTTSEANIDRIEDRDYLSIKAVRIQELEVNKDEREAPFALPIINYYIQSKPQGGLLNQTYSALFNSTTIHRESGLQYRRVSAKPEIKVPYNLVGNLFEVAANVQGDIYNLENNFNGDKDNNFNSAAANYRPEINAKWSLPMVGKYQTNTIIVEPLATIAVSSYKNSFNRIPNEDSNNTELTQNNLFLSDRFTGFDRNEDGERLAYGFKSSLFNDKIGQFNLGLGQGWRANNKTQDVIIRGFSDNNKSNIVGEVGYKSLKVFSIVYNFQLNESNYRNDVNEINASLNLGKFNISSNYILIRRTANNSDPKKQLDLSAGYYLTSKLLASISEVRDLVTSRVIEKKYGLAYDGCCVTYNIFVGESNPTALAKPQRSYSVNFTIKNL